MPRRLASALTILAAAPAAWAQEQARNEEDELVVTSERPRGSVPGDFQPETTFTASDVRSYGATSIFQILAAVAPHTGSASIRGSGMPVILINGRRTSGMQEIRDLPADVISRVEVFDEQLSLQYGFSPDQRVVNIVLDRRFHADTIEAGSGSADRDARATMRIEGGSTDINEGDRLAFNVNADTASSVTEFERGIAPPSVGPDARAFRTLAPETTGLRGSATFARALSERVTGALSLRIEDADQKSSLGLAGASLLERETQTQSARAAAAFDGASGGWQWTATGTADFTRQESLTFGGAAPASTTSEQSLLEFMGTANGRIFDAPAGPVRAALRFGVEQRTIDSISTTPFGAASADLERTTPSGRATLITPITSRRREFGEAIGDISLNTTASWSEPSEFAALESLGFGGSWSPLRSLRFSLQAEASEVAPTLQQLGDPILLTPGVSFFDVASGETVSILRTTGGNPTLGAEERNDLTFNANFSPQQGQGLSLSLSWARNESANAIVAFPTALPETEVAFPTRYTRDLSGVLVALDARPINLAQRDIETIRWGMSFSRPIGGQAPRTGETGTARPASNEPPSPHTGEAGPSPAERRAGLGGGASAAAGRWNLSVFHRVRLSDEANFAPGLAPIDLLDRGGLSGGGEPPSSIEFEGGLFYRGLGLRFNGGWTEGYTIPIASGGALDFSDRWTINARAFVNFDQRPSLLSAAPYLRGARLVFGVENITDSAIDVRDSMGATPVAYQEGYLSPLGRVVQMSLRKQF